MPVCVDDVSDWLVGDLSEFSKNRLCRLLALGGVYNDEPFIGNDHLNTPEGITARIVNVIGNLCHAWGKNGKEFLWVK